MEGSENLRRMIDNKWASTVASVWIQSTSGSLYTFSIYSQALKAALSLNQSTLDTVAVFKDVGVNCGVLSGLLYSSGGVPRPRAVLLAGAAQCFAGYFLLWAAVAGVAAAPPAAVCVFMAVAAHGQAFFNTANVVTGVRNFPRYSGTIVGIMKGFLGLSGAMLVQLYETTLHNKPTSYLLLLALLPTINALLLMWFVRVHNTIEGDYEKKHLNALSLIALLVAAYLMVIIIADHIVALPLIVRVVALAVLILLLGSPIWVTVRALRRDPHSRSVTQTSCTEKLIVTRRDSAESDENEDTALLSGRDSSLFQAMGVLDFWVLFLTTACGMGTGLATVNNMSQIGASLSYTSFETSSLVSLWSIWNFLGRFGAGYVSDYILHVKGWARPLFMVITLAAMSLGHLVIASGLPGSLYMGSVLVGVCYGSQWSLMPTITSEIFGVTHMGTIFNTVTIASPVGSYIFSVRAIGYIYDKQASEVGNTCVGRHCFMLSFLVMASATLVGSLAALALFFRTRDFYGRVIVGRLQILGRSD